MNGTFPVRRPSPNLLVVLVAALALGVVTVAGLVLANGPSSGVVAVASPSAEPTPTPTPTATPTPTSTPAPSPTPTPSATPAPPAGPDPVLGMDGRLTVLLLGTDYRPAHPGNRTDTIMVVSLDPTTGAVASASIPRDTVNFPISSKSVYRAKVNGLYESLISRRGRDAGSDEMKRIVGAALGVEIDSYALVGFAGVRQLIDAVGGVDVVLAKAVSDPTYWVTARKRGVYFPAGRNHLNGASALIFARTRHGDNDFERARRQQMLVAGAVDAVRARGLKNLPSLITLARRYVKTDLSLKAAPLLFEMISKADLADSQRVVFGPRKWASSDRRHVVQPAPQRGPGLDGPLDGTGQGRSATATARADGRALPAAWSRPS